ncbi:hypothetical protein [Massilia soli]|uniref:Uncharacterized protein n=1 Tax=Massilia soli TaxID=2792854 RepID=A0ABS7SNJ5_9BURK|nr:hypothetical protein [Massilia soli]MBZ2207761.1 hypothetical protein [Massilia soli]
MTAMAVRATALRRTLAGSKKGAQWPSATRLFSLLSSPADIEPMRFTARFVAPH